MSARITILGAFIIIGWPVLFTLIDHLYPDFLDLLGLFCMMGAIVWPLCIIIDRARGL